MQYELPYTVDFNSGTAEKTWAVDVRNDAGVLTIDEVKDLEGNDLTYTDSRTNNIVLLSFDEPHKGTCKLTLS
jgi:hypothetical protein